MIVLIACDRYLGLASLASEHQTWICFETAPVQIKSVIETPLGRKSRVT